MMNAHSTISSREESPRNNDWPSTKQQVQPVRGRRIVHVVRAMTYPHYKQLSCKIGPFVGPSPGSLVSTSGAPKSARTGAAWARLQIPARRPPVVQEKSTWLGPSSPSMPVVHPNSFLRRVSNQSRIPSCVEGMTPVKGPRSYPMKARDI